MSYLGFTGDELEAMHDTINALQLCFHHKYAPNGKFSFRDISRLQDEDVEITIIADKNLVSPICEIAKNGTLKDEFRLRKVALFVIWTKFINARLTCGIGLLENDTAELSTATGEENRMQFLHGVDNIPAMIWKNIAFGYMDCVPTQFLFDGKIDNSKNYRLDDSLLLLSNETAMVRIVQILRTSKAAGIDKFIDFMNWYTDHLDIAESIVVYAAMVFANIQNVALPKNLNSQDFQKVVKGIKNQAWDVTYITAWSNRYYNEPKESCTMFATDDITQKIITVNVIPPGQCAEALDAIFHTNAQHKKLMELADAKLGKARIRPFEGKEESEKVAIVKDLLKREYGELEKMCS